MSADQQRTRDPARDAGVHDRLFAMVYDELRGVARRQLRRLGPGHTLSTTALVHEAYIKLAGGTHVGFRDRAHYLGVAARAMRQVLIDHARRYRAVRRGGAWQRVPLEGAQLALDTQADTLLALDAALARLGRLSERLARVVVCRFFGGMTEEETAEALGVTSRTVRRDWAKARLWLYDELYGEAGTVRASMRDPRAAPPEEAV